LTNLDGNDTTINISGGTDNLDELVDKMNAESGGKFSASLDDEGKLSISAEGVAGISVVDAAGALGADITNDVEARVALTSDNGDPVTVTRGSTGTLEQLNAFGFRENDVSGEIEGHEVDANAFVAGDLKINGVGVGASDTGGLKDKVEAINKVSDQTGVTADVFTSVSLDFGSVSLSTLVGGNVGVNGVDIAIPAGGATTTLADVAQAFNDETDATGITATVSGTRVILEGNVSQIAFGPNAAGTTTAVTAALTDGAANTVQFAEAGDESSAAAITDTATAAGGIQLKSNNGTAISVEHKDTAAEAKTGMVDSNIKAGGSFGTAIANISIATQSGAQKAIDVIDNALESVNDIRSELGAVSNRLDFTVSNLSNVVENSSAARSRIMDADFAAESANLSRAQVLQQASQAMLAQANARPQQVLSLLQ